MGDHLIKFEADLTAETEVTNGAVIVSLLFCSQLSPFVNKDVPDGADPLDLFVFNGQVQGVSIEVNDAPPRKTPFVRELGKCVAVVLKNLLHSLLQIPFCHLS